MEDLLSSSLVFLEEPTAIFIEPLTASLSISAIIGVNRHSGCCPMSSGCGKQHVGALTLVLQLVCFLGIVIA